MAVQAVPIDDVQTVINYTELTKPMNINPDALVGYPKQIKELGPMPKIPKNGYEGYFYRFTNLDKLKYYIGSRKGLIKDHYWHSSTCDEFNRDLANPNANFKFEILKVGKHNIMEVIEDEMLRDVKAGQNPSYYNKQSAGSPKYKRTNQKACKQLRDDILSGKYKSKTEEKVTDLIKFIEEDRFFQVRVKLNEEKIIFVANAVDEDIGITELCQIVILENRRNGEDILIDGNHTVRGLDRSKHGKYTFTHRVPEEIHKSFRDQEIIVLCGMLNPQQKFQADPLEPIDTIEKVLMGEIENGVPHGQGTFYIPDGVHKHVEFYNGSKFEGTYVNGERNEGTFTWSGGNTYTGSYKDNKKWTGVMHYEEKGEYVRYENGEDMTKKENLEEYIKYFQEKKKKQK